MNSRILGPIAIAAVSLTATAAAIPWGVALPEEAKATATEAKTNDKLLTKKFSNATAYEVINWLEKQNLNFVLDSSNIPDKRLTLNIKNQPADKVIEAVATALGLGYEAKGDLYVLHKGPTVLNKGGMQWMGKDGQNFELPEGAFEFKEFMPNILKMIPEMGELHELMVIPELSELRELQFDGKGMSKEELHELHKELEDMEIEIHSELKGIGPEIENALMEIDAEGEDLTPEQKKELKKALKEMRVHLEENLKGLGPMIRKQIELQMDGKGEGKHEIFVMPGGKHKLHKDMSPEEKAEFEKQMKELKIELKSLKSKDGKHEILVLPGGKHKALKDMTPEEKAEFEKKMAEMKENMKDLKVTIKERVHKEHKGAKVAKVGVDAPKMKELIASLTDDQKALMKKNGHLKLSDLSKKQKALLGSVATGDGDLTITFSDGKSKITIKN